MDNHTPTTIPVLLYKIIINFDKPFRIMAPGFLILIFFFWETDLKSSLICISKINLIFLFLIIPLLGMCYYSVHRVLFSLIDFFAIKGYGKTFMETNIISFYTEHHDSLLKVFYIFNASIHLSAICCELIIIFYFINSLIPVVILYICFIILFIIVLVKIRFTRLDYNLKEKYFYHILESKLDTKMGK